MFIAITMLLHSQKFKVSFLESQYLVRTKFCQIKVSVDSFILKASVNHSKEKLANFLAFCAK